MICTQKIVTLLGLGQLTLILLGNLLLLERNLLIELLILLLYGLHELLLHLLYALLGRLLAHSHLVMCLLLFGLLHCAVLLGKNLFVFDFDPCLVVALHLGDLDGF